MGGYLNSKSYNKKLKSKRKLLNEIFNLLENDEKFIILFSKIVKASGVPNPKKHSTINWLVWNEIPFICKIARMSCEEAVATLYLALLYDMARLKPEKKWIKLPNPAEITKIPRKKKEKIKRKINDYMRRIIEKEIKLKKKSFPGRAKTEECLHKNRIIVSDFRNMRGDIVSVLYECKDCGKRFRELS